MGKLMASDRNVGALTPFTLHPGWRGNPQLILHNENIIDLAYLGYASLINMGGWCHEMDNS